LLRHDPKTARMPIMFLTAAYPGEQQVFRGYEAGAVDYIVKPYEPRILLGKTEIFLELDRQRAELRLHRDHLEQLVAQRTREARAAQQRAEQREEELRRLNLELDQRVSERTAELTAANAELEAFAYSVSHDLRAPLRAIDGYSQALLEDYRDQLDEQGRHYLDRSAAAARRMGQLIDDLLGLSRITRKGIVREPVNLSAIGLEVLADLQNETPGREVEVVVAPGLLARGDEGLLRQALENLLGNAWKFTAKAAPARIQLGCTKRNGEDVFFVRDNGVGFDTASADRIFSPFQRLHDTTEFPGSGIGLATVQRIIRRHGGKLWAEAVVNEGATFYFSLP
jgi:signal transduction histidine kinase